MTLDKQVRQRFDFGQFEHRLGEVPEQCLGCPLWYSVEVGQGCLIGRDIYSLGKQRRQLYLQTLVQACVEQATAVGCIASGRQGLYDLGPIDIR